MFDKLTSMQIFISVAHAGSFVRAAEQHNISAAMVTRHIQRLEEHLQLKLLQRSTRRLELTRSGGEYLQTCEKILTNLAEAESNMLRDQNEVKGKIRLAMPSVLGQKYLLPQLQQFQHLHPQIELEIQISDERSDLLKEQLDLILRFGMQVEPYLIARPLLAKVEMVVAASPAYSQKYGLPGSLDDLSQHNCLGCSQSEIAGPQLWHFSQNRQVQICGNSRSNNGLILIDLALNGLGVIYQPRLAIDAHLARGELVEAHLDVAGYQDSQLNLVYSKDQYIPKKLRTLIDFILEKSSAYSTN